MTQVKICGLREVAHVQAAVEAGVDFIGFVFAPSKRQIDIATAQKLAQHIPSSIKKVGVFVNEAPEMITKIFEQVPLDYVQFHGDEDNVFIQQLGLPSIKAFSVKTKEDLQRAAEFEVDFYLFDTPSHDFRGGSGQTFDWSLLQNVPLAKEKIILAGGLHPDNVAQAIQLLKPGAVDVSSGVETNGVKDVQRIQQFLVAAKGASV